MNKYLFALLLLACYSCDNEENKSSVGDGTITKQDYAKGSFGYDVNFLQQYHKDLVLLQEDSNGAQVAILPGYQGRVMTSTAAGNNGASFGWINHDLIASGKFSEHMSAFGGEDRFWLGPEGGQFSIYFKKGTEFKFENWFVPAAFDTEPFRLVASDKTTAKFEKEMHLENYSGNRFDVQVNRTIRLLNKADIDNKLGITISGDIQAVAFESGNSITNIGTAAWTKQTGLLSIWILSMMNASPKTTVAVPYKQGDDAKLGKVVTDDYFGKVPADRLKVKDGLILFKADANYRSKIGLSPARALPIAASYDSINSVLTIAQFDLPEGATDYVNSLWQLQDHPFAGDAVNSYNDGPIDRKQMGKFYEVESSSPAAALKPGESIQHIHRTIHLKGDKKELGKITMKLLGVTTDAIAL
jgi:hypothetical protein